MKKIFFLLITGLTASILHSQEVSDALRFSQDNLTGTARFRAMSGAFGALGGDLSSISVNPAGSAIFINNQMGVTFSNQNIKNNSNYFGTQTSDKDNSFILNQVGAIFVFNDRNPNNNWKKIAIGATYENTNNFNNNVFSAGTNPTNSIDNYFLTYANGIPLGDITGIPYKNQFYDEQQAYFGYYGFVINPVNPLDKNNTQYTSNVPAGGNYYHENEIYARGYNSKLSFNISTSYKDRIYFGANLNAHITDYRRSSSFYEDNSNPLEPTET
ncbi:MAG: transporter, partial [Flavobacterium sp.]